MIIYITQGSGTPQGLSNVTDCKIDPVAKTATIIVDITNATVIEAQ